MSWVAEPSVAELLAEPVVRMVMARAGVTANELGNLIAETRARIGFERDHPAARRGSIRDGGSLSERRSAVLHHQGDLL